MGPNFFFIYLFRLWDNTVIELGPIQPDIQEGELAHNWFGNLDQGQIHPDFWDIREMSRHWRHSRCHKNRIKITHRLYCGIDHDFDPTLTSLAQNKYQARGRQLSLTVTLLQIKPDKVFLAFVVLNSTRQMWILKKIGFNSRVLLVSFQ